MKLENLQITLAQRTPWQAIDLGLQVARRYYKSLFIISALITSILALLLFTVSQNAVIACVLVFWFKPIIERPLLFYISRAIFSDAPSLKESLVSLTSIANRLWFKTLFIQRISISRSFNAPAVQLEGMKGEALSRRLYILHHTENGSAWLSILGIFIEFFLLIALMLLPILLLPSGIINLNDLQLLEGESSAFSMLSFLAYAIAVACVAPFYVCCGFILYLNQRTRLEAWDIELGFKKISSRLASLSTARNAHVLVLAFVSILCFSPTSLWADETENNEADSDETSCSAYSQQDTQAAIEALYPLNESSNAKNVRNALINVLDSDVFGEHYKEKDYSLDWDWDWDWDSDDETNSQKEYPWLSLIKDLALYFKYFIIVVLALLLTFTLIKYQPWRYLSRFKKQQEDKPQSILGMDMSQQNLPDHFLNIIENHLTQQQFRQALSLMFRAHLINAIHVKNIPFKQSNTEQECLIIMQDYSSKEEAECFSELVMHWQILAYAHQSVSSEAIQTLFKHWQSFVTKEPEQ